MTITLLTIFCLLGTAAAAKLLHISIQQGQILDKIFNWQTRLAGWGQKGGWWNEYRYKSWGGCTTCFSRFIAFWAFWVFFFIANFGFDAWFHFDSWIVAALVNFFFYTFYCSISTMLNMVSILNIFK